MSIKGKLQQDLKSSLRNKEETTVSVLRMALAALHNKEIEKKEKLRRAGGKTEEDVQKEGELSDEEINEIIFSEIKKRKEAIEQFERGNRQDLVDKEKKELEILKKYIPEQLSEEELREIVRGAIEEAGAESMKDIGKVMTKVMPKVRGRADGSSVSNIVKELLS